MPNTKAIETPALDPSAGRTFVVVPVTATANATTDIKAVTGKIVVLHELWGSCSAGGTVTIKEDSDGAGGGTPTALTGAITLAVGAMSIVPYRADYRHGIAVPTAGRHLTVLTANGAAFAGFALVSYMN